MNKHQIRHETTACMSDSEFELLSGFIQAHCGIKMPESKKSMLESRLQKRLRILGLSSFREYCRILFQSPEGARELVQMIDAVTTNKTDFFREPPHFQFLEETALPDYVSRSDHTGNSGYSLWSAGCSTGEEPYSLAMVLNEFANRNPNFHYSITATDICSEVVAKARQGIYHQNLVALLPATLRQKYFMQSKDRTKGLLRIVPELRSVVKFRCANLMDESSMPPRNSMDAIFCRNVIIYFDRETQFRLLSCLCRALKAGAHLFLGHSETVHGFDLPLIRKKSTIYGKVS